MVTDSTAAQLRAYRKPPSLFRMVPSLTPYDLPSPKWGFHMPPRYLNGHISTTGRPIHFMFCSRVGFSGSADRMALFPVTSNHKLVADPPPSWIISNSHISATAHSIHLCSAHRLVIFAIAQLSCRFSPMCIVAFCFCLSYQYVCIYVQVGPN